MKTKVFVCFLAFCLLLPPFTASAASAEFSITENQLRTLENNLAQLEQNNKTLSGIWMEQETELIAARQLSTKQSAELKQLREQLTEASWEIATAKKSLQIANTELENAAKSLRQSEQQAATARKITKFWRILAVVFAVTAGGIAAAN